MTVAGIARSFLNRFIFFFVQFFQTRSIFFQVYFFMAARLFRRYQHWYTEIESSEEKLREIDRLQNCKAEEAAFHACGGMDWKHKMYCGACIDKWNWR